MSTETLTYMGLPDCIKLSNGTVDLIATTAVGPRILFYGPTGGQNIFGYFPDASKDTALGTWKPYGGHRLWVWPELVPATYAPDNDAIEHTLEGDLTLVLRQKPDAAGMAKQMRLTLAPTGTHVRLEQTVTSHNLWPIDIAAWGISVVASGTSVVPRVPFQSHDDCVAVSQPLVLNPYTDLQDPRLTLGLKYLLLHCDPSKTHSQKIGLRNKENWCAHLTRNMLFVKRFTHDERASYPDYDVNNEVYTEGAFQELELLGPHRVVAPGESLTLTEEWNLFENIGLGANTSDLEALDAAISPHVASLLQLR